MGALWIVALVVVVTGCKTVGGVIDEHRPRTGPILERLKTLATPPESPGPLRAIGVLAPAPNFGPPRDESSNALAIDAGEITRAETTDHAPVELGTDWWCVHRVATMLARGEAPSDGECDADCAEQCMRYVERLVYVLVLYSEEHEATMLGTDTYAEGGYSATAELYRLAGGESQGSFVVTASNSSRIETSTSFESSALRTDLAYNARESLRRRIRANIPGATIPDR